MTYIEFFDPVASENVCACLTYMPDRVIYIGDNAKQMKRHISNYQKVFAARGDCIEFTYKTVSKSNLDNAVALLTEIVEDYDDCVFDITGGDELLNLALGIVYTKYPQKNIQIHKFNLRSNTISDCDKDGVTIYKDPPMLSIEENIRIYGGDIVYGTITQADTYKWDLTPDFLRDVDLMWEICKQNVRLWNIQIGILESVEEVSGNQDGLRATVSRGALEQNLLQHRAKYKPARDIISYLLKHGLLTYFEDDDSLVTVSYKNEQVKRCLTKAGQALEMKIYTTAKAVTDKDGMPVYNDALNGVVIDWDGVFHDEDQDGYDTENEVDVMLMHGMIPVFISCKNGMVTADELYKLNTVAHRFGGEYAKKVLVTTRISDFGEQSMYLKQRAKDMNIRLLERVQDMDEAELEKKLRTVWSQ